MIERGVTGPGGRLVRGRPVGEFGEPREPVLDELLLEREISNEGQRQFPRESEAAMRAAPRGLRALREACGRRAAPPRARRA